VKSRFVDNDVGTLVELAGHVKDKTSVVVACFRKLCCSIAVLIQTPCFFVDTASPNNPAPDAWLNKHHT
jgi:hypothetical protein